MKNHPAWLASGLLLAVVLACNVSKNLNSNSNSNENGNRSTNTSTNKSREHTDFYVEKLRVAKDEDGDATTSISPSDRTVHCIVTFNKVKPGTKVKAVWVAENVEGRAKHTELDSIDHITDVDESRTDFHLTWSNNWRPGTYRIEIYIDGVLDKSIDYTVQ